jgi:rubrerythrin
MADECLKYGSNLMENLNKIQSGKVEEWLKKEDKKWRCRTCGNPIAIITVVCYWCGANLSQ